MVDEHFKDVTKDFNQCPDVLVHSVAFFCLAMQSYGGLSSMLCNHVRCDTILLIIGAIIYDSDFGYIFTTDCTDYTDFRRIHVNLKNLPNLPIDRLRSSYIYN